MSAIRLLCVPVPACRDVGFDFPFAVSLSCVAVSARTCQQLPPVPGSWGGDGRAGHERTVVRVRMRRRLGEVAVHRAEQTGIDQGVQQSVWHRKSQ